MHQRNPQPARGKYLISDPFMPDPTFRRSVVLLTDHNSEGTVGFILNKPIGVRLKEIVRELENMSINPQVFIGGPVQQDSLHFLHNIPDLRKPEDKIAPGVFSGSNFELLFTLLQEDRVKENQLRFFLGYAGWSPGQLQQELEQDSWIVSNSRSWFTFSSEPEDLWKQVMERMGEKGKKMASWPEDPSLN